MLEYCLVGWFWDKNFNLALYGTLAKCHENMALSLLYRQSNIEREGVNVSAYCKGALNSVSLWAPLSNRFHGKVKICSVSGSMVKLR